MQSWKQSARERDREREREEEGQEGGKGNGGAAFEAAAVARGGCFDYDPILPDSDPIMILF